MNCPECGKSAIGFVKWASGMSSFKMTCPNCGAELKANAVTIIGFLVTLLAVLAFVLLAREFLDPGLSKGMIKYILALPVAMVFAFIVYKLGGYKKT